MRTEKEAKKEPHLLSEKDECERKSPEEKEMWV